MSGACLTCHISIHTDRFIENFVLFSRSQWESLFVGCCCVFGERMISPEWTLSQRRPRSDASSCLPVGLSANVWGHSSLRCPQRKPSPATSEVIFKTESIVNRTGIVTNFIGTTDTPHCNEACDSTYSFGKWRKNTQDCLTVFPYFSQSGIHACGKPLKLQSLGKAANHSTS